MPPRNGVHSREVDGGEEAAQRLQAAVEPVERPHQDRRLVQAVLQPDPGPQLLQKLADQPLDERGELGRRHLLVDGGVLAGNSIDSGHFRAAFLAAFWNLSKQKHIVITEVVPTSIYF